MPIFAGNYGNNKVLGLTKTSDQQQEIQADTIFHSSLPYVRVIEHTLTNFTYVQDKMWVQDPDSWYWYQNPNSGPMWWCGQSFPLPAAFVNSLQNTNRGFMIFIRWNDGWWEPYLDASMEHDPLFTWDNASNFTMQQNIDVANAFKNTYGLSRYSNQLFIPRRRVNGQNKVDPNAYVTKVVILELVGLDVSSNGTITVSFQNPSQNSAIYIDNTQFVIGSVNIMQEKYLQLLTNVNRADSNSKTHNVQQDMVYPSSISYGVTTLDKVSQNRTLNMTAFPRSSPPIMHNYAGNQGNTAQPAWDVIDPLVLSLTACSLTQNWTRIVPEGFQTMGGVFIPRLSDPNNQNTYIVQNQSVRRDDFTSRALSQEQQQTSSVMQVGVLNANKFGGGVYLDSTRPQIGRAQRELFSPQTQGVQRVGPTRRFITPREQIITGGLGTTTLRQFHSKTVLTSIALSQAEQNSDTFIISMYPQYMPPIDAPNTFAVQLTTTPQTDTQAFKKTKRSNQDQQVGYTIQGQVVSDIFQDTWVVDLQAYCGLYRATEPTRQVHQISLASGSRFILQDNEARVNMTNNGSSVVTAGIIHYLERVGNTINLVSETYLNQNTYIELSIISSEGLFAGGYAVGFAQVL